MHIGSQSALFHMQLAVLIQILFIDIDSHNLCQKHIVASKWSDILYFTLEIDRTLLNQWSRNLICFSWSQMTLLEFIDVSSRFYAAPVCLTDQSGWSEVDNKLSAFFNDIIGISAGTNRDIGHWRIRVDNAGPCNGNDIWFFFAAAADHCWSYRCQQGRAFPEYFRHLFETSFP